MSGGAAPVWITDAAAVTGLGDLELTWQELLQGNSAIRPLPRFSTERYLSDCASWIEGLAAGSRSLLYPLLDRLLDGFGPVPKGCRLLTATTKGCIDTMTRVQSGLGGDGAEVAVPAVQQWLSRRLGLHEGGVNINAACASSTVAVARGAAMIASGRADAVLVVCMDVVSEFVFSGFSALQALSREGCRPFDRNRTGLSLGEGGAALLLMNAALAQREERRCLGSVAGWGAANDATHITAPARDACGLVQATIQALNQAGIGAEDVAAISAHGTGTIYNDMMELTGFRKVFGHRALPVHSVKGAIGHTLGAAGGIEVAIGLKSLSARLLPPTAGLVEAEEAGNGWLSALPQPIAGRYLLTTNSGFGGVNAALILKEGGSR